MRKKKLKIAIFHLAFIYSGGGEKLVLEEATGLKKRGNDVFVFTSVINEKRCFPDVIRKSTIKTFLPQLPFIVPEHESFQILLSCIMAPFFAFRFRRFNVILAANQPSPWIAWWIKKFFGVPYVSYLAQPTRFLYPRKVDKETGLIFSKKESESLTAKLMFLARRIINWADVLSIRGSSLILSNGDYMKKILEKTYRKKIISCPAAAYPTERIENYESRTEGKVKVGKATVQKPYLLVTNRHFPQKRFEYAISSLATLIKDYPNLTLVITGAETDYTAQIKALVRQLSLDNKVLFLGLVDEAQLDLLYRNALVYLYTAPEEDFGMGIVEAMSKGTPVVAWDNAGPTGIIKNETDGLLATPFLVADFTSQISRIISNKQLAKKITNKAVLTVRKHFSYIKHVKILEEHLKSAI